MRDGSPGNLSPKIFHFPLTLWCSIGHVTERMKLLLNSKGGRNRKGM